MSKKPIIVRTADGGSKRTTGEKFGLFAIAAPLRVDKLEWPNCTHNLMHLPTGFLVGRYHARAAALNALEAVKDLFDWDSTDADEIRRRALPHMDAIRAARRWK